MAHRVTITDMEAISAPDNSDEHAFKTEKECHVCKKKFTTFGAKKMNCKTCFHAVCKECSGGQLFSVKRNKLARACIRCVEWANAQSHISAEEEMIRQNELEALRATLEEAQNETRRFMSENKSLQKMLEEIRAANEKLTKSLDERGGEQSTQEEIEKIKGERNSAKSALEELQLEMAEKIGKKEGEIADLKEKITAMERDLEATKKLNGGNADALDSLRGELNRSHEQEKSKLSTYAQSLSEQLEAEKTEKLTVRQEKKELEEKIHVYYRKLSEASAEQTSISQTIANLQGENSSFRDQLQQLTDEKAQSKKTISELTEKLHQLTDILSLETENSQSLHAKLSQKKAKLKQLKPQLSSLQSLNLHLESELSDTKAATEHIRRAQSGELHETLQAVLGEKSQVMKELSDCRSVLMEKEKEILSVQSDYGKIVTENELLAANVKSANDELSSLKKSIVQLQSEKDALESNKSSSKEKDAEISLLRKEIDAKNEAIFLLEKRVEEAKHEVAAASSEKQACLTCLIF